MKHIFYRYDKIQDTPSYPIRKKPTKLINYLHANNYYQTCKLCNQKELFIENYFGHIMVISEGDEIINIESEYKCHLIECGECKHSRLEYERLKTGGDFW